MNSLVSDMPEWGIDDDGSFYVIMVHEEGDKKIILIPGHNHQYHFVDEPGEGLELSHHYETADIVGNGMVVAVHTISTETYIKGDFQFTEDQIDTLLQHGYRVGGIVPPQPDNFKMAYGSGTVAKAGSPMSLASTLPGVNERVRHPHTGMKDSIMSIIIDLNDDHYWTREQIADWLETLDVDLSFEVE